MDLKRREFEKALASLQYESALDFEELAKKMELKLLETLKKGVLQTFEYTTELCWKAIKEFLLMHEGIEAKSPKQTIKEFYLSGHLEEEAYLQLLCAIDDRNLISHVYDEEQIDLVLGRISGYVPLFTAIQGKLSANPNTP